MNLYSYKGNPPSELPNRIRLEDGSTRTSLNEMSQDEIKSFGFEGPIEIPDFDEKTEKLVWNGTNYEIVSLTEEEIKQKRRSDVDYVGFWNTLLVSNVYKKLRYLSTQSLSANVICTEIIAVFSEAKSGIVVEDLIQFYLNVLFLSFEFTSEDFDEIKNLLLMFNLDTFYNVPDEVYISSHTYNMESNTIESV